MSRICCWWPATARGRWSMSRPRHGCGARWAGPRCRGRAPLPRPGDGGWVGVGGPPDTARTGRFTAVQISRLAASARPAGGTLSAGAGLVLGSLAGEQLDQVAEQAGHVREVLTGYRSGHPDQARPGEPRPGYRPGQPLEARYHAKARATG